MVLTIVDPLAAVPIPAFHAPTFAPVGVVLVMIETLFVAPNILPLALGALVMAGVLTLIEAWVLTLIEAWVLALIEAWILPRLCLGLHHRAGEKRQREREQ